MIPTTWCPRHHYIVCAFDWCRGYIDVVGSAIDVVGSFAFTDAWVVKFSSQEVSIRRLTGRLNIVSWVVKFSSQEEAIRHLTGRLNIVSWVKNFSFQEVARPNLTGRLQILNSLLVYHINGIDYVKKSCIYQNKYWNDTQFTVKTTARTTPKLLSKHRVAPVQPV